MLNLDLPLGLTVKDLKSLVAAETNFPVESQQFYLNGRPLNNDAQTLEQAGIHDGEMLAMLVRQPGAAPPNRRAARTAGASNSGDMGAEELETVRLRILGDPPTLQSLREQNPPLAAAVNDPVRFREVWQHFKNMEAERERERQNQVRLLNDDPFNVDAQRKIEEMIRQNNVMENLQHAYENNPEGELDLPFLFMRISVWCGLSKTKKRLLQP